MRQIMPQFLVKYPACARCDIFGLRRMRYDINPHMPAGISLAAGEYHKSTQVDLYR